uniref:Si:ch211-79k12.2 n=1 Tax=Paramormyrops kingsleyae TaxID=1676925 RepID=A0A3B3QRT3_9TELE|nr:zinc finger protein 79-like isoform X1 [Paramormyrops kingsleyae]XP_023689064.1 zinc finger protein 79-like isoform X1 [Paramormyrops kingsleyae]
MYSFQMDKDRFAVSRGPCSWLEMHQFIGDLMASSSSQPVKDSSQQEALRSAWEAAGHEALGLKAALPAPAAQGRAPHGKVPPGYGLQTLTGTATAERNREAGSHGSSGQQLQHHSCTCPGCPFSSPSTSSPTFQTLKPRHTSNVRTQPSQSERSQQPKESSGGPVSLGLCLGLGLSIEEETSACNADGSQRQQQEKSPEPHDRSTSSPPQVPTFPCLCCHRGFQTCAQLLSHQQGTDFPQSHPHYHHHHCPLASCLHCPQLPQSTQAPAPFPCLSCQRTFQTCAQLLRHQQGHAQQDGIPQHPCMHCSASFPRPSQLLQHQRSQHASKTGGFLCAECGRAFNSHSNLRIHLNVHTGARPYPCSDCGKSFSQSGALKIHRRIHTGERPYTCTFCGRGFPHLAGIRAHQRIHTGEKPYRCPQCGKCFTQSGALKIHMRIHTGERPFVCGLCGKGFSNRSGIRFHYRTVHGILSETSLTLDTHSGLLASTSVATIGPRGNSSFGLTANRSVSPAISLSSSSNTCESPGTNPDADLSDPPSTVSSSLLSPGSGFPLDSGSELEPTSAKGTRKQRVSGETARESRQYSCEDCGRCFRDAPSRNRHQALEHYSGLEGEEEGGGEGNGVNAGTAQPQEGPEGEAVDSLMQ